MSRYKLVLSGNIVLNLVGNGLPMVLAIFTVPVIIHRLGEESFAILSLVWLFIGYFSFLDFGLGRATTKLIIDQKEKQSNRDFLVIFRTSTTILFVMGGLVALGLGVGLDLLIDELFSVPTEVRDTAFWCFLITALTIPFTVSVSAARGALEAEQKFRLVTLMRIPLNALHYLIPLSVPFFSKNLILIVALLALSRVLGFGMHLFFVEKLYSKYEYHRKLFDLDCSRRLARFASWLTVSSLVGPIMVYFDRLIVGSTLSLNQLAYYNTPFEVISKLTNVAGSVTTVVFPPLATLHLLDRNKMIDFYNQTLKGMLFLIFLVVLPTIFFSNEIMTVWIGSEFADKSSTVMRLIAVGVFFNAVSSIPFMAIQAAERPDITAKVHLVELPLYIVFLWIFAIKFGINGMAFVWAARNFLDATVFIIIFGRLSGQPLRAAVREFTFTMALPCIFFSGAVLIDDWSFLLKILAVAFGTILTMAIYWLCFVQKREREGLVRLFRDLKFNRNRNS